MMENHHTGIWGGSFVYPLVDTVSMEVLEENFVRLEAILDLKMIVVAKVVNT